MPFLIPLALAAASTVGSAATSLAGAATGALGSLASSIPGVASAAAAPAVEAGTVAGSVAAPTIAAADLASGAGALGSAGASALGDIGPALEAAGPGGITFAGPSAALTPGEAATGMSAPTGGVGEASSGISSMFNKDAMMDMMKSRVKSNLGKALQGPDKKSAQEQATQVAPRPPILAPGAFNTGQTMSLQDLLLRSHFGG